MSIPTYPESTRDIRKRESQLLYLAFALLCLGGIALAIAPAARVGTWGVVPPSLHHLVVLPVWVLGMLLVRTFSQEHLPQRDPLLLPIALLLAGWGMLLLWRVAPTFGARQTGWFLVASIGLLLILRAPADLKWLQQYRYLWLFGGICLILLTLIFGTNPSGGEPRLWLGFFGIYFQPSEPLRLLLVAFLASYFADRLAYQWLDKQHSTLLALSPLVLIWTLSILLLFIQRDLGTGTLFLALLATLLFIATNRWQVLLVAFGLIILGAGTGYAYIDVVQTRLQAWINPWADPIGGSFQLVQSLIGIASGGIFGRGPGMGAPGFVPAAHTDFIFTALTEEWGLVGGIAILTLFAILISRGIKIAYHLRDPFDKMLASGLTLTLGLQTILIIGGVIRLLPLTGVTLPFVSYGGSSLLTSFLALGLLLHLSNKTSPTPNDLQSLKYVQIALNLGWVMLALTVGWWAVFQSEELTSRTDNPRRAYVERFEKRGTILDNQNVVLSESIGPAGDYERVYSQPSFSSVLGYNSPLYGLSGIEKSMDPILRGETIYPKAEIIWSNVLQGHPPPGLDIRLTLDSELQNAAYEMMEGKRGAIVLFESPSGDLLVLLSSPTFNSNSIDQDWEILTTRTDAPLLNRTTQSQYQPGMTLAPFLIGWGLEQDLIDLSEEIIGATDPLELQGQKFGCSTTPPVTDVINIALALKLGCPSYFSDLGIQLGGENITELFNALRFNEAPNLRIDSIQPDDLASLTTTEDLMLAAIGQGTLTVTPVQIARAFGALVNEGVLPPLRIIDSIQNPQDGWDYQESQDSPITVFNPQTAQDVVALFRSYKDDIRGFSYQAIVGAEQESIHWFLGTDGSDHAIVVVIEGESREAAEQIGVSLLGIK